MRKRTWMMLAIGAIFATTPAGAQTYDPSYPICLHVYTIDGDYFECRYTSLAQCQGSASGRPAQCVTNPYFARIDRKPPVDRRQRGIY
jgi:Protein of unknown function (DUF3551)